MANILFLFEGAQREKKYYNIIGRIFENKIKKKVNFFYYGTNIHVLYEDIKKDPSLDIIELIKERAKKSQNNSDYKMLNENKFGEIYLIFDLDPQDEKFNCDNIQEMLNVFNNETENGKLYINYPMIESFKHFRSIPDSNYNTYKIKISKCVTYKQDVANISCINHFKEIDENTYYSIVRQNVDKVNQLINNYEKCDYDIYINTLNQNNIFSMQRKEIEQNGNVYIVNSLCMWPLDYNKSIFNAIYT